MSARLLVAGVVLAASVAGCSAVGLDPAPREPVTPNAEAPPPPGIAWHFVGQAPNGQQVYTACTPWGDRLYATSIASSGTAPLAVIPARPSEPCTAPGPGNNRWPGGPGSVTW